MTFQVIFLRHGESEWNQSNRFTGWYDASLTKNGIKEAKQAGILLKKHNFSFDIAYTSVLKRAIYTLWSVLKKINQPWLKVHKTWRFNERHYGELQGFNKENVIQTYGKKKIIDWRRSFRVVPPKMKTLKNKFSGYDKRYFNMKEKDIPYTESLELTLKRVLPYWNNVILPEMKNNKKIIVVAHGNSLRALITFLDNIRDEDVPDLNIPTGKPFIYEFNKNCEPIKYYYL
ncbi:2,3-diphosphoglycerate-dependent phosphoglycerate mutase [Buchnera aphidicola]|uniref:2,3-diphosphoglycerate-dependent phosphoglycerate mutase n=1 Tax=Buchnera aphidicola TaxID=9 RepID=UPI002237A687|nr:2,3-diphosphoglycerate-dependent phosphoglycerate mutase [Buchnera aphidicola]MCW5197706.1 2,3-diphosphoglycerate-dependent phosphoglycerate mutase [Buchnera aphidicola (Chaitophorus viminalis)]